MCSRHEHAGVVYYGLARRFLATAPILKLRCCIVGKAAALRQARHVFVIDSTDWAWDMVTMTPNTDPTAKWLLSKLANAMDVLTGEPLKVRRL